MSVFIIAEIGINHNGDLDIAKKLIKMAKNVGCNAVKFQKRSIDKVYSSDVLNSPRESPWGKTTREQKQGLEFGEEEYSEINQFCKDIKIEWFASAWDIESQKFLRKFDCNFNKIASAMLTHEPLLREVASERKKTFISTGMSTFNEIDTAVKIFLNAGCEFTLMHSVSIYPCPDEQLNLNMIRTLKKRYNCPVGYSGHESSPIPSIAAAALGITALERHITLDRSMYGTDQSASLEKRGLEILVNGIRTIEVALGSGEKIFSEEEKIVAAKLRYW